MKAAVGGRTVASLGRSLLTSLGLCLAAALVVGIGCYDFSGYVLPTQDPQDGQPEEDSSLNEVGAEDSAVCKIPPGAACGTYPPCGCLPGQACDVIFLDGRTACLSTKNLPTGAPCKEPGECAPGNSCVGEACKAFCHLPVDCPVSGALCFAVGSAESDGGTISIPGMRVCSDQCNLAEPEGRCGAAVGCIPLELASTKPGHSACTRAGTSTTKCVQQEDCVPGRACLSDGSCHRWCEPAKSGVCESGQSCKELDDPGWGSGFFYVGESVFGICQQ